MTPEEQAALAQMMIGLRTVAAGLVQQADGILRFLTKDAGEQAEAKKRTYLGQDDG